MARKSQALVLAESQVAELTTQVGVLMNQVKSLQSQLKAELDNNELIGEQWHEMNDATADLEAQVHIWQRKAHDLEVEKQELQQELFAAQERISKQGQVIAAQPKTAPPASQPKKPAPKPQPAHAEVESQPTVEINDFDRVMYRKFNALPREQRLAIIAFARPIVGHVGIHNIVTVRAAWHEHQAQAA